MLKSFLKYKIRIQRIIEFIFGLFIVSCVSGPVTTQIDLNKNPVVGAPTQFQSPTVAIDKFLNLDDPKALQDPLVTRLRTKALYALIGQQTDIAKELKQTGRLLLQPGQSYEFSLESFCVNAGIDRPVSGDGLFLNEMQGRAKSWLPTVLGKYQGLGISQEDAQVLVWLLLSKSKFDQLNSKSQSQLLKIFPDAPIRFGNAYVEDKATEFLFSQAPTQLISAKNQFDKYREILEDSKLKYSEIEQVLSPQSKRNEAIEVGWLKHEDGYFIHLQANGYQQVRVKIYAPVGLKKEIYFEPTKHVALPGQGQRLAISNNVIDEYGNKILGDLISDLVKWKTGHELTEAEKALVLKYPKDAYKICESMVTATNKTNELFDGMSKHNTKADAFRHFIWSGLSAQKIGTTDRTLDFLKAHEDFSGNPPKEIAMDMHNNKKGVEFFESYKGTKFEEDLIKEGLEKVRTRELKWIK